MLKTRFFEFIHRNELIFGVLLFLFTVFLVAESRWSLLDNAQAISSESEVHLYLPEPTNLDDLAVLLQDSSLIDNKAEFKWAASIFGWKRFQKGHYLIADSFTYDEFLSKLARGIQDPVSVTILPGKSLGDITQKISNQLKFDSLSFHQTITDTALLNKWDIEQKDVIGRLFPNTYSVYWTISPDSFFNRILSEFDKAVVEAHKQKFDDLHYSVDEIITMASIIEWEAQNKDEKSIIGGLYWNRLERGMRLQADPTVNFAVGERRRLLYNDYQADHPYNTYLHRGLPPGPITNPDMSSIKAALYPAEHDYLYMVATPEGEHAFSRTFEEHKQKSAKWRRWLQEQYKIKRMNERTGNSN